MKNILLLMFFLQTQTIKTSTLPYLSDTIQGCPTTKYLKEDLSLCCNKCPPGQRLKEECTESSETVCESCPLNQYMENWNYAKNCHSCRKCTRNKGLQYAQICSSATNSKCVCMPGKYCLMTYQDQCQDCEPYRPCKVGLGVSVPATPTSNVKCKKCPEGTFSDTVSYTDVCKLHSSCDERDIIRKGDTTSDNVCKPAASTQSNAITKTEPAIAIITSASSTPRPELEATLVTSESTSLHFTNSTNTVTSSISTTDVPNLTKTQRTNAGPDNQLAAVIGSVAGIFLLIIIIVLVVICKQVTKKDALEDCLKVDANGNCENDNTNLCYMRDNQRLSLKGMQPEQQCFLENGEVQKHCISAPDGFTCNESIGSLQSTLPLHQFQPALSEPMTLQSQDYSVYQNGAIPQPSSQPTSPQNMTPSPLVNVNINLHIGNGACGTPAVTLKDMLPADPEIPFGEEEESCSLLRQEDGKPSLLSVEESKNFSDTDCYKHKNHLCNTN